MKNTSFITILLLTSLTVAPVAVYSRDNVFAKSPVVLALERSYAKMQQRDYYRGAILDYDLLSRHTQVPLNVLQAAVEMSDKEGKSRNEFAIGFAESVGQYLAEGRDMKSAVHATLPNSSEHVVQLLQRAIEIATPSTNSETIRLRADNQGHFWGTASIEGKQVEMMLDTGASSVLLTQDDAYEVGIVLSKIAYDVPFYTAAGEKLFGSATVKSLSIFGTTFHNVPVYISPEQDPNGASLLGMSVLKNFSNVSFSGNQLVIRP